MAHFKEVLSKPIPQKEMTTTPRTDLEEKEAAASRHHCGHDSHIESNFARQLETEIRFANSKIEEIQEAVSKLETELTNAKQRMNNLLQEHDERLRTARAAAFEEAAEMVKQRLNYAVGDTLSNREIQTSYETLLDKAAAIRKETT